MSVLQRMSTASKKKKKKKKVGGRPFQQRGVVTGAGERWKLFETKRS